MTPGPVGYILETDKIGLRNILWDQRHRQSESL